MISVPGYSNLKVIHQSAETLVYSARRTRDSVRVVLRQLRPEVASPDLIARYRKEYELLHSLDCPYIIAAHDLIEFHGTPILILEYLDDARPLNDVIEKDAIDIRQSIFIARGIAEGLDYLHAHNVIHKDINPTNIIYSPGSRELKIIDFGVAAVLSSSALMVEASEHIEGTLPWISPEQTGRMNRSIDYRSDFYSLGATLYTLLTGQAPFLTDDTLKLVYSHIATRPVPPDRVNERVPAALSRIVMKLLSKAPEDRYQSAHAIKQDLSRCVELMEQDDRGAIDFEVALDDIPEQLNVSERLLEREEQRDAMLESLRNASVGETEILVCTGEAGSGKTTLTRELQREVTARGGFFVQGKHTLINSEVPYRAIHAAFADLIRQLHSRPDFHTIRHRIIAALEGNTRLLTRIVPELSLIVDEPGDERSTSSPLLAEAKVRLAKGLAGILNAVCNEGTPIVLCIDNLQWIDSASIELFDPLFNNQQLPYVMLVCAYRTGELTESDETDVAFSGIVASNPQIKLIHLDNLNAASVNHLISDSLFRPMDETRRLAELVHAKTSGNPLAVREFLINLNNKKLLYFDRKHREWSWDFDGISNEAPTDNVSEMLANKINDLEAPTSRLLQVASCIGDEFDLDTVQDVSGLSYSETSARLSQAVREGYLLYQPAASSRKITYRFAHDRIQQAAYMLLNMRERRQIHTSIGQTFLHYNRDNTDDHIFDIVNQLNNSFESPDNDAVDKKKLAELNLTAGRKAKQAAAFQSAFKYFRTAIALYGQNVWAQYDSSLEMHLEAAETAYLCGDYEQLKLLSNMVLRHVRAPLDQSRIYEIQLRALVASNELDEAIAKGNEVLELLGVDIPKRTGYLYTVTLVIKLLVQLARVTERFVTRATPMKDPHLLAAMRILMIMVQAGYLTGSSATPLYILKMTQLSMKHGMAPESSFAYPMFGALLITYAGTIDYGYRFGALANKNIDNLNLELHCRTITLINNFILTWKHPIKDSMEPLINAYRIGMETGDIEFALVAAITRSTNAFILGHDLNSLESNLAGYNRSASQFNQTPMLSMGSIYQQTVINLIHPGDSPWLIEGDVYSESEMIGFHQDSGDESSIANLYILKLYLSVLFKRGAQSLEYVARARESLNAVVSSPLVPFFVLYESLACLDYLDSHTPSRRMQQWARVRKNQRMFRKWAHHAPENILHGYHLVEARRHEINGKHNKAADHYELAIELSRKHGFLKEHGLANEMTGRFYLNSGKPDLGLFYLRRARTTFVRWGAMAKVNQLDEEFANLREEDFFRTAPDTFDARSTLAAGSANYQGYGNFLDLGTVIKASQVLSGEIILENLLERLMQVALENAGAHNASLILNREDHLIREISTRAIGTTTEHHLDSTPIEEVEEIPTSVIQYVARTREDLVLNDALNEDIFTQDDYIISQKPKSILCIPILSQSHLTGVLYLENLQSTHAFSQDRVAILKLLASQSAIAIENAKLYRQLNDSRNKYLSLYQNAIEGIFEVDLKGRIITINPAAVQLLGYDAPEEVINDERLVTEDIWINPEDMEKLESTLRREGRMVGFETRLRRKDNDVVWVAISAHMVSDEEGNIHLEGSIIDITERRLREEAEQAKRVAEAAAETKSQFLANMSHEIRTPMNAIIGYTDLALRTNLNMQQSDYLETIRNSSNHLLRVVNDILDISKVESGKLELQKLPFRLEDILLDLESLFGLEAASKGLQLILPDSSRLGNDYYLGDPVRIGQVLINLISNAIKFTNEGEIKVDVEILDLGQDRACFNFSVSDTGIGIDEAELESIFESFTQGVSTSSDGGTGLGLAICKRLVEMMDGHIHATSRRPEPGSILYFSIIVEALDELPIALARSQQRSPARLVNLSGRKLLLVEDNQINQDLAREVLTHAGLDVTVANDGKAALEYLDKEEFLAVLMDIRMPVMDGMEAIRIIRRTPRLNGLPVIALSASVLSNEVEEALAAGFDYYVTKPVNFSHVLNLLRDLCGAGAEATEAAKPVVTAYFQNDDDGIDFEQALRNHNNDESLLVRLMGQFVSIYEHADTELNEQLQNNEKEKAERLAHNIAGVAGSFGASSLMNVARELEHRIADEDPELMDALERFSDELQNLVTAIKRVQSAMGESIPAAGSS